MYDVVDFECGFSSIILQGKACMIGIIVLVIVVALYLIKQIDFKRHPEKVQAQREGKLCAWCHRIIAEGEGVRGANGPSHILCEKSRLHSHVNYYRFFMGCAIFMTVMITLGTISDISESHRFTWSNISWAITPFIFCWTIALSIRWSVKNWENKLESRLAESGLNETL